MSLTKKEAMAILNHLKSNNMAFCFYGGLLISREACEKVINS
jgi:hypothetical protein